ncbi:MAG: protein tyrosine phosphatase family protein [Colwellia sp.]
MRIITLLCCLFLLNISTVFAKKEIAFDELKNYRVHSEQLSSSGLASNKLSLIADNNYSHIINLIPGDYTNDEKQAVALGMSYQQIAVDWENPKLSDFHRFAYYLHNTPKNEKTLVHCKLNYRASTFAYLYQVIVKKEDQAKAKEQLLSVWQPTPTWLNYMDTVLEYYNALPNEPLSNSK